MIDIAEENFHAPFFSFPPSFSQTTLKSRGFVSDVLRRSVELLLTPACRARLSALTKFYPLLPEKIGRLGVILPDKPRPMNGNLVGEIYKVG